MSAEADAVYQPPGLAADAAYMQRALALARKGLGKTRPNPAVGCVVLSADGEVRETQ